MVAPTVSLWLHHNPRGRHDPNDKWIIHRHIEEDLITNLESNLSKQDSRYRHLTDLSQAPRADRSRHGTSQVIKLIITPKVAELVFGR